MIEIVNEAILNLKQDILLNNVSIGDKVVRLALKNDSRVIMEFEDSNFHRVELYGTDLSIINSEFNNFKSDEQHYNGVDIDKLSMLFKNSVESYNIIDM